MLGFPDDVTWAIDEDEEDEEADEEEEETDEDDVEDEVSTADAVDEEDDIDEEAGAEDEEVGGGAGVESALVLLFAFASCCLFCAALHSTMVVLSAMLGMSYKAKMSSNTGEEVLAC